MRNNDPSGTTRRSFLGTLATGAAAFSLATVAPVTAGAKTLLECTSTDNPEDIFKNLKGKHKMVFDVTQPHEIFPFAWPRIYLLTNEMSGAGPKDTNAVVVLRHAAIPYAMKNDLWVKYKFGEMFKAGDPKTDAPATRNPFWMPQPDDFVVPGVGSVPIGINQLQDSGVKFCVCNMALTVYSAAAAQQMNLDKETVRKEWVAGLLPGITIVPSGVWALGRAQEHGCGYCFAS